MSRKFKTKQVVRFCGGYGSGRYGFPDDGDIGVVTEVASAEGNPFPYSVTWFLSRPAVASTYSPNELRAVDDI
jgi:hypothetical protein